MSLCINPHCPKPNNSDTTLFCQSCHSELLLEGRYRITKKLGKGGFSKTYEVSDSQGIVKVLKILINDHPKYIELFQREAEVLQNLEHPGIPKVEADAYFSIELENSPEILHCLVMEKVEGLNLRQYLNKRRSVISQKRAFQWLIQLTSILRKVHSHNFFHRDVKPSNIMLRADGQLVLIDFGAVRQITGTFVSKQSMGQITGVISAGYTPPEQVNGKAVPQSDFFALGRTFVFLLTGKDPIKFYDSYIDALRWREAAPQVSVPFANFLDGLMARLPQDRPYDADTIWQQLLKLKHTLYPSQGSSSNILTKTLTEVKSTHQFSPKPPAPPTSNSRNHAPTKMMKQQPPVPESSQTSFQLEPGFIELCQRELAEFIGPMASIICKRTLSKNPKFSTIEFVEVLAKKIPDQEQSLEFKKRLLLKEL